ncbi:MAG TPA: hypothetical protein VNQ72_05480 [Candidatus Dormibacteraeota bacterium]|jgi:hypothetical protein|nr:hypothetical protein [Candidatus Dormibacteraeota bacterium]
MRSEAASVPRWARSILFWRKVLAVERGGIPGSRYEPCGHRGV